MLVKDYQEGGESLPTSREQLVLITSFPQGSVQEVQNWKTIDQLFWKHTFSLPLPLPILFVSHIQTHIA